MLEELKGRAAAETPGKETGGVVNQTRYNVPGGVHGEG